MKQRVEDIRDKEVINVGNGGKIGYVCDVEMDTNTARLTALVIYGRARLFGILGRDEDVIIPWENVKLIGGDTILVDYTVEETRRKNKSFLTNLIEMK